MTIFYNLQPNKLTEEESFAARVQLNGSADLTDIVSKIVGQGTTVRPPDILAVLENAIQAANDLLLLGIRVNFGDLVDLYPKISGKFSDPTESFDPARHSLEVGSTPGKRIRANIRKGTVAKLGTVKPVPSLLRCRDLLSGTSNEKLTLGGVITLDGTRLKVNREAADEGLFFIPPASAPVPAALYQKNTAGQLVVVVPPLTPGPGFHLEVRTRYTAEGDLRVGRMDSVFTVVAAG